MKKLALRLSLLAAALLVLAPSVRAQGLPSPNVGYSPLTKIIQGTEPFSSNYVLSVTSPDTLTSGKTVSVPVKFAVLGALPTGVSNATALGFITASPSTLTFTGPNQTVTTTITLTYPAGNFAGSYAYNISMTDSAWGVTVTPPDLGAQVNATVAPAQVSPPLQPPSVTIQTPANLATYTYVAAPSTPVTIPIAIQGVVGSGNPTISALSATINGTAISGLVVTGLGSLTANGTYSYVTSTPGTYIISATATNSVASSTANVTVTVVAAAVPPTVTVSNPSNNSTYSYTLGSSTGATVPLSFTGTSLSGNITALSVTLDGTPVSGLTLTGVNSALVATGIGSVKGVAAGTHTLVFTATNSAGSATQKITFTVTGVGPPPTVTISTPSDNATYSFVYGSSVVVPYAFSGSTSYGTITSAGATLAGPTTAISPSIKGLNTANITGSGTLTISTAGTYTITATDANAYGTASDTATFTVTMTYPKVSGNLYWLPPLACNQTQSGGGIVPIAFTLLTSGGCDGAFVKDTQLVVVIYEIYNNGSSGPSTLCTYSSSADTPPSYTIDGSSNNAYYLTRFTTATGNHHYHVEVYQPLGGTNVQILADTDFYTQGSGGSNAVGGSDWSCSRSGSYSYWGNDSDATYGGGCSDIGSWFNWDSGGCSWGW